MAKEPHQRPSTAFDDLPERVRYYLLDYRDDHRHDFYLKYKTIALRDLTAAQLKNYFRFITAIDLKNWES